MTKKSLFLFQAVLKPNVKYFLQGDEEIWFANFKAKYTKVSYLIENILQILSNSYTLFFKHYSWLVWWIKLTDKQFFSV